MALLWMSPLPASSHEGAVFLSQKPIFSTWMWELCSGTGVQWELTRSPFTFLLSLDEARVVAGSWTSTICLPGFPDGMIWERNSLREVALVQQWHCWAFSGVAERNAWWVPTKGLACYVVTAHSCCKLVPGRGERLISVHTSGQVWAQLHHSM